MANRSNIYSVNVDGEVVFTGSYKTADVVWRSICRSLDVVVPGHKSVINISFCPRLKGGD